MSSIQQSKVPVKGTIIINPKTSRPVKVGSRVWLKLVREGVVEGKYKDPNELYTLQEGDDVDAKIEEYNQSLPPNVQSVRGRGKYANKIVKRNRQPSTRATARQTVRATARKVKDPQVYEQLQEADNFEDELEQLIMAELTNIQTEPSKHRGSLKQREHQQQYYTEQSSDDDFTMDNVEQSSDYEEEDIGGQYEEQKYQEDDYDEEDDFSEGSFE